VPILLIPLTKWPKDKGRYGPLRFQDWYRGCAEAVRLAGPGDTILVVSDLTIGGESEARIYVSTLKALDTTKTINIEVVPLGFETVGQLEVASDIAVERQKKLLVISTFLHAPRVWWLTRKEKNIEHRIVFGIPRPREAVTDLVLDILFPLIDSLGFRERFLKRVRERRQSGIF
jgi:hypothetical protein